MRVAGLFLFTGAAMADDALQLKISGDVSDLDRAIQSIVADLNQLGSTAKTASSTATDGLTQTSGAADRAGASLRGATVASEGLFGAFEGVGRSARTVAIGLDSVGLGAAGAAAKVAGLTDALLALKAAVPELLILAAAVTAMVAAFNSIKDGIKGAGDVQAALAQLGNSVRNQGGDWQKAESDVKGWAQTGVQRMVAAGLDYQTAQVSMKAATDEAIASGRPLQDVEYGIQQAIMGHTRALVSLGVITTQEAKNGIALSTVIQRITDSTHGAEEAFANTLPGALAVTHEKFALLTEDLGELFLPALIDIVQNIGQTITSFQAFADGVASALQRAFEPFAPIAQVFIGYLQSFAGPLSDIEKRFGVLASTVVATVQSIGQGLNAMYHNAKAMFDAIGDDIKLVVGYFGKQLVDGIVVALDAIKLAVDAFVAIFTGRFSTLHDDLIMLAGDIVKQLSDEFLGNLGSVLAGVVALFQWVVNEIGVAAKAMGDFATHNYGAVLGDIGQFNKQTGVAELYARALAGITSELHNIVEQSEKLHALYGATGTNTSGPRP
jgi:hypothetical protein